VLFHDIDLYAILSSQERISLFTTDDILHKISNRKNDPNQLSDFVEVLDLGSGAVLIFELNL
jgi:hypothetical protein